GRLHATRQAVMPGGVRRAIIGGVAGAGAAALSVWLANSSGLAVPFVFPAILAVVGVGLTLGAAAAVWAYAIATITIVGLAIPTDGSVMPPDAAFRVVALAAGTPVVILLMIYAERQRSGARQARDESLEARRLADEQRQAAEAARRELQLAVAQVEEERARLQEVAEAIPEPLIVYDPDGRGRYANRAALRVFGRSFYDREVDAWGRQAMPRDERGLPMARDEWPQLRARRQAVRRRMTVRLPMSGRDLLVDVEGTPIPDGGSVLLLRDVGKEVDERRRLSRFASFVAHELRNPLAVAKARIELASREPDQPRRAVGHEHRALESVDAAIGILERLELFSRAEAGRLEASMESFDLRAAAGAAVERLRARGSAREVRVLSTGRTSVVGDRRLTEQAITNLLTNADRYSKPSAPIEIEIKAGQWWELRVRDSGPGIPDDVAQVLFRERVSSGRGLGLGLYLVNAAMEAQGGSVELEERAPRTVFLLRWRRTPSRPAPPGADGREGQVPAEAEASRPPAPAPPPPVQARPR
ncbi:MAG: ATP-binding protein, partial [Candidatus Limnocylindria bacterium]